MPKRIAGTPSTARGKTAPASMSHESWPAFRLKDRTRAAAYLEAVIEDGDQGRLKLALRHIAQSLGGVATIARKSNLTREATERMFSKSGNPEVLILTATLGAAGLRLSVGPIKDRLRQSA